MIKYLLFYIIPFGCSHFYYGGHFVCSVFCLMNSFCNHSHGNVFVDVVFCCYSYPSTQFYRLLFLRVLRFVIETGIVYIWDFLILSNSAHDIYGFILVFFNFNNTILWRYFIGKALFAIMYIYLDHGFL